MLTLSIIALVIISLIRTMTSQQSLLDNLNHRHGISHLPSNSQPPDQTNDNKPQKEQPAAFVNVTKGPLRLQWTGTRTSKEPVRHVYYLKTHKTGSTTLYSILSEYSRQHNATPLLPREQHINQMPPFHEKQVLLYPGVEKYDMLMHHMVFNTEVLNYLHDDVFLLTILREPYSNFVSAFNYYRYVYHFGYLAPAKGNDLVLDFLQHFEEYEIGGFISFTNNRQSMDLGYDMLHSFNDTEYIKTFIAQTEKRFDLVLVTEYFDESLIILKRALHWKSEDILYMRQLAGPVLKSSRPNTTDEISKRKLHTKYSTADIMLYEHFLGRFMERMKEEHGLQEEVTEFRAVLKEVYQYCGNNKQSSHLVIGEQKWSDGFQMSYNKCVFLSMDYDTSSLYLRKMFYKRFHK